MEIKDMILEFLQYHPGVSRPQIMEGMSIELGDAQMKRVLADCVASGTLRTEGKARATKKIFLEQVEFANNEYF